MRKQKLDCLKPFDVAGGKSADVVSASRLFPGALLLPVGLIELFVACRAGSSGNIGGKMIIQWTSPSPAGSLSGHSASIHLFHTYGNSAPGQVSLAGIQR